MSKEDTMITQMQLAKLVQYRREAAYAAHTVSVAGCVTATVGRVSK